LKGTAATTTTGKKGPATLTVSYNVVLYLPFEMPPMTLARTKTAKLADRTQIR